MTLLLNSSSPDCSDWCQRRKTALTADGDEECLMEAQFTHMSFIPCQQDFAEIITYCIQNRYLYSWLSASRNAVAKANRLSANS